MPELAHFPAYVRTGCVRTYAAIDPKHAYRRDKRKRQGTTAMVIPCLCSFPFTALHTLAAEPPVNKKRTQTLFRKESGSSTNCMVEHQGVEPWHRSPGLSHFDSLATSANCISQIWCQSMCNQLPLRLTSTPRRTKSAHSFSGWRT